MEKKLRKVNRVSLDWHEERLYHEGEAEPFTGQYTYYHDNGEHAEQSQVKNRYVYLE